MDDLAAGAVPTGVKEVRLHIRKKGAWMKRYGYRVLIGLWSIAVVALAGCSAQDAGENAYKQGDYAKALAKFSASDTPKSAYYRGLMYYKGEGVPRDAGEAARQFRSAADRGYADAQFDLGTLYAKGDGVPLDKQAALDWYLKAAAGRNSKANFNLGLMYLNGDGVRQDREAGLTWIRKAADLGNERAKSALKVLETK